VFSGQEIGKDDAELVWTEALAAVAVARASVSRGRRILSRYRVSAARRWAAKLAASADAQARSASSKPTKNSKKKK